MNRLSQTVAIQYDSGFSPYEAAQWRTAFADLAEKGLTGVEVAVAYPDRVDAAELLAVAQSNALAITTISTGQICGLEGVFLTAPEAEKRACASEILMGQIALSRQIGRPPVTVGLIRANPKQQDHSGSRELLAQELAPLWAFAAEQGVILQLEPINRQECPLLSSTADALAFLEELGNPPALGILYDTFHSYLEDGNMAAAIHAAGGRITNVHLSDSHRGLPGEGNIPFTAVREALEKIGYQGAFALETLCVPFREHVLLHYADSLFAAVS